MARRNVVRAAKRKFLWLQFAPSEATSGVGMAQLFFSLNAAALALRPFTIVRSHFEVMVRSDQEAAVETQIAAIGLAVVSDQAVAVGITAVPTTLTEAGSSLWFMHRFLFGEENSLFNLLKPTPTWALDSKAMRKVEVGSDLVVVGENGNVGGSGGIITTVAGRILIKTN